MTAAKLTLEKGLYDISAFHAQQAVEKALKALLIALGQRAPKTHDIGVLLSILKEVGVELEGLDPIDVDSLTAYAVESRYPGPPIEEEEARYAISMANEVVRWVVGKLGDLGVRC